MQNQTVVDDGYHKESVMLFCLKVLTSAFLHLSRAWQLVDSFIMSRIFQMYCYPQRSCSFIL